MKCNGEHRSSRVLRERDLRTSRHIFKILHIILLGICLSSGFIVKGQASDPPSPVSEYQAKAAFVFNFAMFANWPKGIFPDEKSPLVIGVLGSDQVEDALKSIEGEKINDRKVTIEHFSGIDGIRKCHLLFISSSERHRLKEILQTLGDSPVLTVSDMEGFTDRGGMIGFLTIQNRIRFTINLNSVQRTRIKISSRLLNLATNL